MEKKQVRRVTDEEQVEISAYRPYTVGMLRRYLRRSVELGRLPSVLGREFFRAKVSSYRVTTFEDGMIFVHDVERCLEELTETQRALIARVALEEREFEDAARVLGCNERTVRRGYWAALDALSEVFVAREILRRLGPCQEAAERPARASA